MWVQESFLNWTNGLSVNNGIRFILIPSRTELDLTKLDDCVLVFHAEWSGYSYENMSQIFAALRASTWPAKTVAICRYDGFTEEEIVAILGARCHGYAESVLIRGGKTIVHFHRKPDLEPFLRTIREQV